MISKLWLVIKYTVTQFNNSYEQTLKLVNHLLDEFLSISNCELELDVDATKIIKYLKMSYTIETIKIN